MRIPYFLFQICQILIFLLVQNKAQLTYKQSDRAQIMYVQALSSTLSAYDQTTATFNFPQPFQNTPKVILNVQSYYTYINFPQSYKLQVQTVTLTSVTVKVESFGTDIYELNIGILAVDYPNALVFTKSLTSGQSVVHKVDQKIQSYITFFTSFQANSCIQLEFNLDSTQQDDQSISVQASNFSCLSSLDYNILVIYYDITNFPDMPFYSYKSSIFSDNISSENYVKTNLQSPDTGFYGLKDMKIGSLLKFGIFFYPSNQSQPIQNGSYVFHTSRGSYIVYYANSQVFDLQKLQCPPDQYLYKQSCIISPYNGIYCQNNPNVCFDCDSNCLTCQNSATYCLKCLSPLYFYNNKCFNSIQPGTFCDVNYICQTCNLSSCSTCIGDANFCTSCISGYYFYNNKCTQNQPNQTYCKYSASLKYYECFPCDSKCNKCSGPFYNQCSECINQVYFYSQSCTIDQPQQTICTNYICQPCFSLCQTCSGVNQNQCLTCINNYSLNSNTNQCEISSCQDGYFPDKNLNTCLKCQLGCSKCSSYSVCSECASIKDSQGIIQTYILDTQHQSCYLNCPNGKYFDLQTRQCTSCDKSCLTCNGKTNQNCLSCINGAQVNSQGMCKCINKNVGFSSDFTQCIPCQINYCSQCFYSNTCEVCQQYALFDPKQNQCVCMSGYFYSSSYQKCIKCIQTSCQNCLSDGKTCTKCQSGFLLSKYSTCVYCNNYQYSSDGKSCDSKCPNLCEVCVNGKQCVQYSRDEPDVIPNQLCHYSCSGCSGLTKFDCLDCSSKTRLYNNISKKCECIQGYLESNQKDCAKIQQVEPFIQNMSQKINHSFYFAQSALIFFSFSPSLTYSYQLQQFIGNIYYINNKDKNSKNLFSQYTKYNLNNIYSFKKSSQSPSNEAQQNSRHLRESHVKDINDQEYLSSDIEIITLRDNQKKISEQLIIKSNLDNQSQMKDQIQIRNLQENNNNQFPIVSQQEDQLEVLMQSKFFNASIIPLLTTLTLFFLSLLIHIYQYKAKRQIKFSHILRWNSVLFMIQINSNYLLMSSFNIELQYQDTLDIIMLIIFGAFYSLLLVLITIKIYKGNYYGKSFFLINYFYSDQNIYSKYYFVLMQIKQIIICMIFSFSKTRFAYSIWSIVAIQIADIVIKFIKKPFKYLFDFYTTLLLDGIFCILMLLFGIVLNTQNESSKVSCYTIIFILLMLTTFTNIVVIIYKVTILIINRRKANKMENLKQQNYKNEQSQIKKTLNRLNLKKKSFDQLEMSFKVVKWQKNPLTKSRLSSQNYSLEQSLSS
ncbi:H-type lectin domain protein (macronuclear) [Tetrahymena thermophila SB210]|uniref:H-type lectin domain protein n=1 Tax=Tetrahymena thermophila (strain SB210) TaxID=312017 RepID=Q23C29_TETTS|nr:H-type lectin domain protein [Tetrahymena thermophila SB210]EAR93939.2 H-type lectin domain protein [Tetrahymena thermophila SB210]|eukprot:XP_001014184.2 H-type lectin domain protein [Tetrahymena thermophila SB210]